MLLRRSAAPLLQHVRPAAAAAHLAPVLEFSHLDGTFSLAPGTLTRGLCHQQASLSAANQAGILIGSISTGSLAPGAGFGGILDNGHDHRTFTSGEYKQIILPGPLQPEPMPV